MCNYTNTHYPLCGCTTSLQTEVCGYQDEDYSECMRWTTIKDSESEKPLCGRDVCKHRAPTKTRKEVEWSVNEVLQTPQTEKTMPSVVVS